MGKDLNYILWSNNWHIEGNKAWFVDGLRDSLYYVDLELNKYEYIADIPNTEIGKFRLNPMCLKIENEIYLMPHFGRKMIWIYNLDNNQFEQIVIDNPDNLQLTICRFWIYENKIYALSLGLQKIIEIDIREKIICNYFILSDLEEKEIEFDEGTRVGDNIYCVSSGSNRVYQFNLETKQITAYDVPMVKGGLYTISFDGQLFWLSGYRKEIYLWDKESNSTKVLSDFPQGFGIYDFAENSDKMLDCTAVKYDTPTFIESMLIGNYIWFIPFQTNMVLYADTETYQIYALEIDGEEENRESLMKNSVLAHKYLIPYIRDERYIGLYSIKNNYIIEIDAVEKRVEKKSYRFGEKTIENYMRLVNGTLHEGKEFDRMVFSNWLMQNDTSEKEEMYTARNPDIGTCIYREIQSGQKAER